MSPTNAVPRCRRPRAASRGRHDFVDSNPRRSARGRDRRAHRQDRRSREKGNSSPSRRRRCGRTERQSRSELVVGHQPFALTGGETAEHQGRGAFFVPGLCEVSGSSTAASRVGCSVLVRHRPSDNVDVLVPAVLVQKWDGEASPIARWPHRDHRSAAEPLRGHPPSQSPRRSCRHPGHRVGPCSPCPDEPYRFHSLTSLLVESVAPSRSGSTGTAERAITAPSTRGGRRLSSLL